MLEDYGILMRVDRGEPTGASVTGRQPWTTATGCSLACLNTSSGTGAAGLLKWTGSTRRASCAAAAGFRTLR